MPIIRHPRSDARGSGLLALALSFVGILLSWTAYRRVLESESYALESAIERLRSAF